MGFSFEGKKKKARCQNCGRDLGIDDYICCPHPKKNKKRVNLCKKCYDDMKNEPDPEEIPEDTYQEYEEPEKKPKKRKPKKRKTKTSENNE